LTEGTRGKLESSTEAQVESYRLKGGVIAYLESELYWDGGGTPEKGDHEPLGLVRRVEQKKKGGGGRLRLFY